MTDQQMHELVIGRVRARVNELRVAGRGEVADELAKFPDDFDDVDSMDEPELELLAVFLGVTRES